MATRGGKSAQEDTGRVPTRVKSATGGAAPKKSNGESKRAAPQSAKAGKASPAASARAKGNGADSKPAVHAKSTAARVKKSHVEPKVAEHVEEQPQAAVPSREERRRMIEVAAYLRAERAGFGTTNPMQDWIEAEREVEQVLAARQI